MISPDAKLSIERIDIDELQVKECQPRYFPRLQHYIMLMETHPHDYPGLVSVTPSDTHPGMYALLDGHHRFCAAILTGRRDLLCLVIEEPQ